MNISKIALFTSTGIAAAGIALAAPGIAAADFAAPGIVSAGGGAEVREQAIQGELREANDSGLLSGVSAHTTESDKAIPVVFAWPTWDAPTIGGVGIETSAGGIGMADSQALN